MATLVPASGNALSLLANTLAILLGRTVHDSPSADTEYLQAPQQPIEIFVLNRGSTVQTTSAVLSRVSPSTISRTILHHEPKEKVFSHQMDDCATISITMSTSLLTKCNVASRPSRFLDSISMANR